MKRDIVLNVNEPAELLSYMKSELRHIPAGKVKSFLEHRQVSVDGMVTTKFNYPLSAGCTVRISMSQGAERKPGLNIIYEDDWIIAINKPAGLLAVATDTEKMKTAYSILRASRRGEVRVVHRLDRGTSGVLIFAKDEKIREKLQDRWDELVLHREYLAVCEGSFERKEGRCDTFLSENSVHVVYSSKDGSGKRAITNYEVLEENGAYSLVKILLETGRKNQIRVHMKELGHPVVGDKKYGSNSNPLRRLGLHARALEIAHPVTGRRICIIAEPERCFTLSKKR